MFRCELVSPISSLEKCLEDGETGQEWRGYGLYGGALIKIMWYENDEARSFYGAVWYCSDSRLRNRSDIARSGCKKEQLC
jgi:hypothetical protein